MHLFTVLVVIIYVNNAYIAESNEQKLYASLLGVGLIFPVLYETI